MPEAFIGTNVSDLKHGQGLAMQPKVEIYSLKVPLRRAASSCREILQRSALHGFPAIFSKDTFWILKVVWILCIILSWSYFGYQAYNTLELYQSYPKVTQISKATEILVDFPGKTNNSL